MNEELQSTNEELETMNDELNMRTDELNQTNVFLESILRSIDAGVVVLDEELRVLAWNKGSEELWGLRADEVISQHFMNLDFGFPVEQLHGPLRQTLAGSSPEQPLRTPAVNRRGRPIDANVRMSPLVAGGSARGVILFVEAEER
jgi:two-component system CheB/CheR fusion protein